MPTAAQLLDLDGIAQRSSSFRFEVLNAGLQRVGTINPVLGSGTITNDGGRAVHRTLEGLRIPASEAYSLDTIAHRIRPLMILETGTRKSLGVFLVADASWTRRSYGSDLAATLVDQGLILDQEGENGYGFPPGTNVGAALRQVLQQSPVPSFTIDATSVTLGAWTVWPPDAHVIQVVNDLARLASFYPIYFDNDGVGRVKAVPDLASSTPMAVYEAGGRIIDGSISESNDLLTAPNRYRVINTGSADAPIFGSWDIPDTAPHSRGRRGFTITKTIEMQGIATRADAEAAAKAAGQQDASTYAWATFSSPPDPRHDTFDVVRFLGNRWREQSWKFPLREGGAMQHDLRRVYS